MTQKEFFNSVSNGKADVLQIFLDALAALRTDYCVIGGLAVNAYAEPIVSLDLDIIVAAGNIKTVCRLVEPHFKIEKFAQSVNLGSDKSSLRIQMQTDLRYQAFIERAVVKSVLGYVMKVACVEDVLQGKIWAYSDEQRRKSKRQKDLADIFRLVETRPDLVDYLPEMIKKEVLG